MEPIIVMAGTPVDTRMGMDLLAARGLAGLFCPVSEDPNRQTAFQISPPEEKAAAVTLILTVLLILLRGKCAGVEVYGAFLSGAKKGMDAAWQLLPALTGMLLMLSLMNASGLTALLVRLLSPLTAILNLPQEVAPMLILRPMTGSGSLAALQEIFAQYGADSRVGRIASVLMGSSETIFYTMSVYLGAAGVKKLPGALGVSLLSYLTCAWVCGLIC